MRKMIVASIDLDNPYPNAHRQLYGSMEKEGWSNGMRAFGGGPSLTDTTMALLYDGPERSDKVLADQFMYEVQRLFEKHQLEGKIFVNVCSADAWAISKVHKMMYDQID